MRKIVYLLCGLLMLAMMQTAYAAKRLGPPIEDLQSEPERVRIILAEAIKKTESNRIHFSISERLSGEAPDEVALMIDEETFSEVVVGRSYIVAWTYLRRNRRLRTGWEENPDGPYTVQLMGLGVTTVFEDTPDTRFLFAPGSIAQSGNSGKQIDALLAQLQREDFRTRGLVISELYLRNDLTEAMNPAQVDVLKGVLQNQALDPQHRDFVFRAVLRLPPDLTSPWLAEEFRKTIILHGTQYDLSSFVPGLVRTAARGLQQAGAPSDIDLLSSLLYSNNPGVSKAALAAMNQLDPGAALVQAERAIERGWIHGETRRVLLIHVGQARYQASETSSD
jgi:hypothetical protein